MDEGQTPPPSQRLSSSPLSPSDIDLLRLLAAGASAAAAAERLQLTLHTVGQRLQAIRRVYGVTSTAEAIDRALHRQHLPKPPDREPR